jgi:predicted peptidase
MIRKSVVLLIPILLVSAFLKGESPRGYESQKFVSKSGTLLYRILYPEAFQRTQKYALILVLHGAGERGSDNELQLTHGSNLFLQENVRKNFPAIVIFPQCPLDSYWSNVDIETKLDEQRIYTFHSGGKPTKAMKLLLEFLDQFLNEPYVDKSRLYLGGLSMGGMGTFELLSRRPKIFAAAFPICGGGDPASVQKYAKDVSVWIFHGSEDDVVPAAQSKVMAEALKKAGADVKLTLYPGVEHESWVNAFAEPELLPWLFSHRKIKG